ncbi:hypothetical protein PENSUB_517 [Penicillium subrubescens]|uniref:Uncharacterized protein n=1 Tax=Penicillium subrubescens TaxID=1316194 RepID=A0A1Q5UMR6_9EURO|nr:hypothetical protein PENSUB_517 [Penicillium subrubescens]
MASVPPSTDTIAELPLRDIIACRSHMSDNLMTWYTWAVFARKLAPSTQNIPASMK